MNNNDSQRSIPPEENTAAASRERSTTTNARRMTRRRCFACAALLPMLPGPTFLPNERRERGRPDGEGGEASTSCSCTTLYARLRRSLVTR